MASRKTPFLPFLLLFTACGDSAGPDHDSHIDDGILKLLPGAQTVAESMVAFVEENPTVQSLSALKDAFTFGGDAFSGVLGKTFVYNPGTARYERDDTREGAPANGVRFLLYEVTAGLVVLPLQEIGAVDLVDDLGAPDTALTIRVRLGDFTAMEYAVTGSVPYGPRPWQCDLPCTEDMSNLHAEGSLSDGSRNTAFRLTDQRDADAMLLDYQLRLSSHGEMVVLASIPGPYYFDYDPWAAVRIAVPVDGGGDSTIVTVDWESLRCHTAHEGVIRVNGESVAVTLDAISSETLDAFWESLASPCGLWRSLTSGVGDLLSPAMFAFTPPDVNLEARTVTRGTRPDPDGYLVTLDDTETSSTPAQDSVLHAIGINDTITFPLLRPGRHTVLLSGFAANCTVRETNLRFLDVALGMPPVTFEIDCGTDDVHLGQIAFNQRTGYDRLREIFLMNADGSEVVNLTNSPDDESELSWSPDGTRLAFEKSRDFGPYDIYVMNWDGTGQTNLTNSSAHDHSPVWSRDGTRIAFRSNRDGNARCPTCEPGLIFEIYLMNADGSQVLNLTANTVNGWDNAAPTWSPDGTQIAFLSSRNEEISRVADVYVIQVDGTAETRLTDYSAMSLYDPLAWSPDGSQISFMMDGDIYVMNADGSGVVNLTNSPEEVRGAAWSPDWTRIAFVRGSTLHVMQADGSGLTLLANDVHSPTWSPGGDRIAVTCTDPSTGHERLCVVDADGNWLHAFGRVSFSWFGWRP